MPGLIPQYNTTEVLPFKMVSGADSVTPVLGLVAGLDLFVTISKNGGAFAAPAGTARAGMRSHPTRWTRTPQGRWS